MTETHAFDTALPDEDALRKIDSCGLIHPLMQMKIVDDKGNELPPNGIGEIILKGPKVIRGYWNLPEISKKTIVDGWLHTGDVGRIDEDGYLYILDRIKDVINRGGEKIFSLEVESLLFQHPKVLDAAVIGKHDDVFGEQVKAVVVLKPGENATIDDIRQFCAERIADYKVPKYVEFRDLLPRNPSGKVLKRLL